MSRRLLFQFYEQPEQNTFSMFMLPMMKTVDNGVNQVSDLKTTDASCEERTNVGMDTTNAPEQTYYVNDIDENIVEEELKRANKELYSTKENNASIEKNVELEKVNTPVCPEEEKWIDFEDSNSETELQNESNDGTIDDEYKNQPDLVQSCWRFTDRFRRRRK